MDIAIIGMACRFPGADSPSEFWDNIRAGVESVAFFGDRSDTKSNYVAAAGRLRNIDRFDAELFGFTPRAAALLDPQHRLFLHCAWEAFEDAGIAPGEQGDVVGAFVGCGVNSYLLNNLWAGDWLDRRSSLVGSAEELQLLMSSLGDFLPSRAAYYFNLRGPVVNVQSACSTSLVAVHLACQSLAAGECEVALAGCSTIRVPDDAGHEFTEGAPFSPDGRTRCFDEEAGGTVFGSGVGAVLLKPLDTALEAGDPIHAVICGTAINNDGRRRAGFTAPGVEGQVAVLEEALAVADVPAGSIDMIEAHGTATAIGDRIELEALRRAYRRFAAKPCLLGSVKANIGHLSWSAGMASLIKTVSALKHREVPPNIHFRSGIADLDGQLFTVNARLTTWADQGRPRRAAVSAFGLGGTNAHLILEESPNRPAAAETKRPAILPLSARTEQGLRCLAARHADHLARHPDVDLAAMCRTAAMGRRHFDHRLAITGHTTDDVRRALDNYASHDAIDIAPSAGQGPVAFLFTGQGPHPTDAGVELYETIPQYRQIIDRCDRHMEASMAGRRISTILAAPDMWSDLSLAYPAHFAFQCALAHTWSCWGITPDFVMGHSAGEYAAACVAGVMRLEDGLDMARRRGILFQHGLHEAGAMASIQAPPETVAPIVDEFRDTASIAAVNGPLGTIISGSVATIAELRDRLSEQGFRSEPLAISRAGHSPLLEPALPELGDAFRSIDLAMPKISIVSNLTGAIAGAEIATPDYWVRQSRETVLFAPGIETLTRLGVGRFVEIGPATTLLGLTAFCRAESPALCLPSIRPSAGASDRELATMLATLGELYTRGAPVDWRSVPGMGEGRRVHLPVSPLEGKPHWIEAAAPAASPSAAVNRADVRDGAADAGLAAEAFIEVSWQPQPLPERPSRADMQGVWLLVGGGDADADAFARRIAESEGCCRRIPLPDAAGIEAALQEAGGQCRGVIVLPSPVAFDDDMTVDALCDQAWQACEPQAALARALSRTGSAIKLWIVSRAMHGPLPPERADRLPEAATWAVGRVFALEHPAMPIGMIDVGQDNPTTAADRFVAEARGDGPPASIAWCDGTRVVARLRSRTGPPAPRTYYHTDAIYVLVGGLGDIGQALARHLAARGAKHLLLIGRRDPNEGARAMLADLERQGVEVQVETADAADSDALLDVLRRAALRHPIRGIFHLAGRLDDEILADVDPARFKSVLRPKAGGAWNLHHISRELSLPLDVFVLFSSATAMVGNGGQASHAAANAILDQIARHRAALGLPGQSIAWGVWSEIGKLSDAETVRKILKANGFGVIGTADGMAALDAAIDSGLSHIGVIPASWDRFLRYNLLDDADYFADLRGGGPLVAAGDRLNGADRIMDSDPAARRGHLTKIVADIVASLTGEEFDAARQDDLRAAGLDSLGLVQLCGHLRNRLGVSLSVGIVLAEAKIPRLVNHLLERIETGARVTAREKSDDACPGLSPHQQRWLSLIDAGYGLRVVPIVFSEVLDQARFRSALLRLIDRHAVLRLIFDPAGPRYRAAKACLPPDEELFLDLGASNAEERHKRLDAWVTAAYRSPSDPRRDCSWTLACVDGGPDGGFILLLVLQHLEFDGTGLTTFADELHRLYVAETAQTDPALESIAPYSDFVREQQAYSTDEIAADRAYFQGLYAHVPGLTRLSGHAGFDMTRPLPSRRWTLSTEAAMAEALERKARRLGVTPFSVILAAYGRLVGSITDDPEVTIAMITSCRTDPRFDRTIGPFTAPYPVPLLTSGLSPDALAQRCQRTVSGIIARTRYPVADLVEHVAPFTGLPTNSYFSDVGINFTNYRKADPRRNEGPRVIEILGPVADPALAALAPRELKRVPGLHLVINREETGLAFNFWYHSDRFSEPLVQSWGERYKALLAEMTA